MSWAHVDPAVRRTISAKGGAAVKPKTHERRGRAACAILYRCGCGRVVRGPSAFQHAAACARSNALERVGSAEWAEVA